MTLQGTKSKMRWVEVPVLYEILSSKPDTTINKFVSPRRNPSVNSPSVLTNVLQKWVECERCRQWFGSIA